MGEGCGALGQSPASTESGRSPGALSRAQGVNSGTRRLHAGGATDAERRRTAGEERRGGAGAAGAQCGAPTLTH